MKLSDLGDLMMPNRQRCPGEYKFGRFTWDNRHECDGVLTLRFNRTEKTVFWGCSNYPQCKYGKPFNILELDLGVRLALLEWNPPVSHPVSGKKKATRSP